MARTWYLVQSKPRNEARALENLLRQGYETYLPLMEVERLQRGKLLRKMEPLFPRYLFLHLEEGNDNWGPIRSTLGIAGMVRFGLAYATVSDAVMMLDLRNTNALLFKNAGTGKHNMVYRRGDGSIGWVEPS